MPLPRAPKELLAAVAALACVVAGARLLAGETRAPAAWSYAAVALGCAHAAALGALTVAAGRRAAAVAWAPALLWPLLGPAAVAAAPAALVGAVVIWSRRRTRPRLLAAGGLGAAALTILIGSAAAAEPPPDVHRSAPAAVADVYVPVDPDGTTAAGTGPPDADGVKAAGTGGTGGTDAADTDTDGTRGADAADTDTDDTDTDDDGAAASGPDWRGAAAPVGPAAAVRAYYRALDERAFARAWRLLSPAVRAGFGGFATWRAGFAATRSSRPEQLRQSTAGQIATVSHVLAATDATACGLRVRRFALTWTLQRAPGGWRATAVTGRPLDGAAPCG